MTTADAGQVGVIVADCVGFIDRAYGLYLDARLGFLANADMVLSVHKGLVGKLAPGTDLDSLPYMAGRGDPNDPANVVQHQTTQGQFRDRNRGGGDNHVLMGQMLIVLIFSFWEHEYRPRLAAALGHSEASELKIPLLGDLRLLRHDIVHHRGILQADTVRRLQVIPGMAAGVRIEVNEIGIEALVRGLKIAFDQVVVDAGGADPNHRKLWRV